MMPHLPKLADGGTTDLDAMKLALMNKGGTMPQHERDANLEKFLKDSAVKDRLYHGTSAAFNQFDPKKIGSSTDEGWLGHGHYFTTDPSVAGAYGSAVMPVHISAKNPYDMNGQNFSKVIKEHGGPKKLANGWRNRAMTVQPCGHNIWFCIRTRSSPPPATVAPMTQPILTSP